MTTGEKIAVLRKEKGITQEAMAESLNVSRQSVSRWEMDAAFPETEKLIKLSRLLNCSIDFLLNGDVLKDREDDADVSAQGCFQFLRECTYFFLATVMDRKPRLRPMGFVFADDRALYLATDNRKSVYSELIQSPFVEIASYNLNTRKWIRINGRTVRDNSGVIREKMEELYPMIRQEYIGKDEMYLAIFKMMIEEASIH
ncbi:MAG: helix-turn-helix domain-containing protein [Lachnospiraceae bacterium]|nr:helix-turn-helix domain-containing protein [Lachnospiraceae bacterium]